MTPAPSPGKQSFAQSTRLLKVHTSFPDNTLLLDEFSGTEAVSTPFQFRLRLLSEQADLELKQVMGDPMTITLMTSSQVDRYFHGHVIRFAHTGSDGGMAFYEAVLGPWLEFLRHRIDCRVFQELNVLDIIRKVFSAYGTMARFEIDARESDYKPLTLCCQYNESDLAFVMRLLEEHGLYFYFRFEKNAHVLIIDDDSTTCLAMPMQETIEYNVESGATKNDNINQFTGARRLVSNAFAAKTYDFKKPGDPMLEVVDSNFEMGDLPRMEWYEYPGAYAFVDDKAGKSMVRLRIEEQELKSKSFHGASNVRSLTCAHAFELKNHYGVGSSVHDRTFFVMSVTHRGVNNFMDKLNEQSHYDNQFLCVRKHIPFRPGRSTDKPVMRGLQTATVVGSSSDEIHCDKYGRVLVQFHWDREGQFNAQSLCWVRVATQWAGSKFGFVSLPRVGTEVLVDFLEGDPDRPIITGAVYNEANMPPWELPNNKTQSGLLTRSTTGGNYDNSNALRFEDKKGSEEVWLHAEKDQRIEVEHDESHEVGHDRRKTIKHDENVEVVNNRTEKVGVNETITIGANRTETVMGNETIAVTGNRLETVTGSEAVTISQARSETVLLASTEQVGLARNLTVGAAYTIEVGAAMNTLVVGVQGTQVMMNRSVTVKQDQDTKVGGNHTDHVDHTRTIVAGDAIELVCGKSTLVMKKDGTVTLNGKTLNLNSTSDTIIKAKGSLVQKGQKIMEN